MPMVYAVEEIKKIEVDGADKLSRPSRSRDAARSIRHQIIVAAQNGLDLERSAGRSVGISSARGQHT